MTRPVNRARAANQGTSSTWPRRRLPTTRRSSVDGSASSSASASPKTSHTNGRGRKTRIAGFDERSEGHRAG